MNRGETANRYHDQRDQRPQYRQAQQRTAQPEEGGNPSRVQCQLPTPQPQRSRAAATPPGEPTGHPGEYVKHAPDRSEYLVGRRTGWSSQGQIPSVDCMLRHRSTRDTNQDAQADKACQRQSWGQRRRRTGGGPPIISAGDLEDTILSVADKLPLQVPSRLQVPISNPSISGRAPQAGSNRSEAIPVTK